MFVEIIDLKYLDGLKLLATFIDGKIIQYDVGALIERFPQLSALNNRKLFVKGKIDVGGYGIIWNDELDLDAMEVYENGTLVSTIPVTINQQVGYEITRSREKAGLTQVQLSKLSGIDQADISKIERGIGNPSLEKLKKIANALNAKCEFHLN